MKELERRLKAEREARLLDRSGARKRLEEGQMENEELRRRLEKEIERRESLETEVGSGSGTGPMMGMGRRSVRSESLAEELEEEDGATIA